MTLDRGHRFYRLTTKASTVPTVGRNESCPCGSGKKFKRCHLPVQPRTHQLTLDFGVPVRPTEYSISPDGRITMFDEGLELQPAMATNEARYERLNKPKVLHRSVSLSGSANINPNEALLSHDFLFGIDTNTADIGGQHRSISVVAQCDVEKKGSRREALIKVVASFELPVSEEPPERAAWHDVIRRMDADPFFSASASIGIVVDADLATMEKYNLRGTPVCADALLPRRFTLIYGSADAGGDYLGHQIIKLCDTEANRRLRQLVNPPA